MARPRVFCGCMCLNYRIASLDNADEEKNYRRNKENMDKPTDTVDANDSEEPEDKKYDCDGGKHDGIMRLADNGAPTGTHA